jgi:site-specific DNA recombinase
MSSAPVKMMRCAVYTRKSSEEGLEQEFNSLHAQRDACEAFIRSQLHEGWILIDTPYDDGGFSGGNIDRPALEQLKTDIAADRVDVVLVYKVDRLSRSLADFVQLVAFFDEHDVAFAAVTQQFNTSTSMGRLTLNVLLSFAQFEREVTSERIRDKIAASKKKGLWMGGRTPLGYRVVDRKLIVQEQDAELVRYIYERYLNLKNVKNLKAELDAHSIGSSHSDRNFTRGGLYTILKSPTYIGEVSHKGERFPGEHLAIVDAEIWHAAQSQLEHNRQKLQQKGQHLSLLAGLLFDDKGNSMSPTHSRKGRKRYRYYVSQAVLHYRQDDIGSVQRISGPALEQVFIESIREKLRQPRDLMDLLHLESLPHPQVTRVIEAAHTASSRWTELTQGEQKTWLNQVCERIEIGQQRLAITMNLTALRHQLSGDYDLDAIPNYEMERSVNLQRCGRESRLVIAGQPIEAPDVSIDALRVALKKGLTWSLALRQDGYRSYKEIAEEHHVRPEYVKRLCSLSLLAPEVMQGIVDGKISEHLTLEKIKTGIPSDWIEQRNRYLL